MVRNFEETPQRHMKKIKTIKVKEDEHNEMRNNLQRLIDQTPIR